jgi:hypothetical protein
LTLNEHELAEWDAYFALQPFGEDIQHIMMSRIMSMVSGKPPSTHMPRVQEDIDPDTAFAEAFLQQEIRLGHC